MAPEDGVGEHSPERGGRAKPRPEASAGPLVSVVLPTRNRVDLLRDAVDTVRRQTWRELELLVVDDASGDGTAEFLRDAARADDRVRAFRFERRRGAAAARNHAIAESRGEYVAFQDDDCVWAPDKLERLVRALEEAGADTGFAYSATESVELDGTRRVIGAQLPGDKYRGPWTVGTYCVMLRRGPLLAAGGFDERFPRLQDFDLWVRLLATTRYVFVPRVLVRTVRLPGGISTRADALVRAVELLRQKYHGTGVLPARDEEELYHKLGHKLMMQGLWRRAVSQFVAALRVRPSRLRSWLALAAAAGGLPGYRAAVRIAERVNWRGAAQPVPSEPLPGVPARARRADAPDATDSPVAAHDDAPRAGGAPGGRTRG